MKYPPKEFQETNFNNIIKVIVQKPLATLITVQDHNVFTSHIPLIHYKTPNLPFGKLIGHIDIYNPQLSTLKNNAKVTAIFHGPDSYISPSLFENDQLPTWNYIKVHVEGKLKLIGDKHALKASLIKMTEQLEAFSSNYVLPEDHEKMNSLLDYIVGFEIEITSWEGKFKLSQNKSTLEQNKATEALIENIKNDSSSFIKSILENFKG
ncbi:FMN-binding negative transcriptional regulator [Zhouia amylolytica]|nr:FMN-binding negative transcriptional regulator [Zhouia amylolytica]